MKKNVLILVILSCVFAVDYETEIQPIFNSNCGNCHLGNSSGGLNLSSYVNLMSNDVIEPGNHQDSELYDRITRDNADTGDMPPGNSELSQSEIDLIAFWIDEGAFSEEAGCTDPNAISCEDQFPICEAYNIVEDCLENMDCLWDSVGESCSGGFSVYFPECEDCSDIDPCFNFYDPNAVVDNGLCMYNVVPSYDEFILEYDENVNDLSGFNLDWSAFTPPVEINQYALQRCLDPDGDTDGDGFFEFENCIMIIPPNSFYLETSYFDEYSDDISILKYTLYVDYPNNNYWGSAHGYYYYEASSLLMGDLNFDGVINVIDIVTMVNGILSNSFEPNVFEVADLNGDDVINVIDIVSLVNLIIS